MDPTQNDKTASQDYNVKLLLSTTASTNEESTPEVFGEKLANEVLPTLAVTDETSVVETITDYEKTIDGVTPVTNRIGQMSPILSNARIHLLDADSFDSDDGSESKQMKKSIGTNDGTADGVESVADNKDSIKDELGNNNKEIKLLAAHSSLLSPRLALSTKNDSKVEKSEKENHVHEGENASLTQLSAGNTEKKVTETGTQTTLIGGMIENSGNTENPMVISSAEGVLQTTTSRLANESHPNSGNRSGTIFFDPDSITTTITNRRILHLPNTGIHSRPTRRLLHFRNHHNFAGEFDREQARLNAEHRGIQNLLLQFFILMILAMLVFGVAAVFALISKL